MNNVMIDNETLGKKRECPVLSIAAVQFDPQTGAVGDLHAGDSEAEG